MEERNLQRSEDWNNHHQKNMRKAVKQLQLTLCMKVAIQSFSTIQLKSKMAFS